jgi:hypothetical protein
LGIIFLLIFRSGNLSGSAGGLVQNEISDKIKTLREDSINKYRVTRFLETWEKNLSLLGAKLSQKNDTLVKGYKLPLVIGDINFVGDSVNSYSFYAQFNSAIINSLNSVVKLNNEYGVLTAKKNIVSRKFYSDNTFTEEDKTNIENLKIKISNKLAKDYNDAFEIAQADDIFAASDDENYLSRSDVERIINADRKSIFEKGLELWKISVKSKQEEIADFKEALINEQKETRGKIQGLLDETKEINSLSRDKVLLVNVLPVFTVLILLLFAIPYIYRNVTVKDGVNESNVLLEIFSKGLLLKVFTVFLLTISIVLLAIGNKIQGETIGTLLGGISVYILQNSFGAGNDSNRPVPGAKPAPAPGSKPAPASSGKTP